MQQNLNQKNRNPTEIFENPGLDQPRFFLSMLKNGKTMSGLEIEIFGGKKRHIRQTRLPIMHHVVTLSMLRNLGYR